MHHYFEAITNTSGDSLVGYYARVIDPATQNTITMSADDNGTPIVTKSGVDNMGSTDDYGNLDFYVVPGTYHLDIYAPNATSFIFRVPSVAMNSTKGDTGTPGATGDVGPSDATFPTLAALKAIDPIVYPSPRLAAPSGADGGYVNGLFTYQTGNFTARTDVVQLNSVPLTTGALVPQSAQSVAFLAATTAKFRPSDKKLSERKSVQDFGASVGSAGGVPANDQPAFSSALAFAASTGTYAPKIDASYWAHPQDATFLPAGAYSLSQVIALTGNTQPFVSLHIYAVPGTVVVLIPDGQYAFTCNERMNNIYCYGINFAGGKGTFQHTYTGVNVNGELVFERCVFDNYTECAIGNNAVDAPYLEVTGCSFMAAAGSQAIGIAWGGYADGCLVRKNKFLRNYIHIKWGPYQSGSSHFENNDMLRWDSTTPFLANFWFVPNDTDPDGVNAGNAHIISGTKFGNENMQAGDVRILIAKEAAGANRQVRMPDATWYPTGAYLQNITVKDSRVACMAVPSAPFCRSYIGQFRGVRWQNNRHDGGAHTVMVEYMGTRPNDYTNMNHKVELFAGDGYPQGLPFRDGVVNGQALIGVQDDPDGLYGNQEMVALPSAGGDDASLFRLGSASTVAEFTNFSPNGTYGGASAASTNNYAGIARAVEVTVSGNGQGLYFPLDANLSEGKQVRVALILARGSTNSSYAVRVYMQNQSTGAIANERRLILTSDYNAIRLRFQLPATSNKTAWQLKIESIEYAATANKFRVAEVQIYQARDYANTGHIQTLGDGLFNGQHFVFGKGGKFRLFVDETDPANPILRFKTGGAPTSATDGKAVTLT